MNWNKEEQFFTLIIAITKLRDAIFFVGGLLGLMLGGIWWTYLFSLKPSWDGWVGGIVLGAAAGAIGMWLGLLKEWGSTSREITQLDTARRNVREWED